MNLKKKLKNTVLSLITTACCLVSIYSFGQFIEVKKDFPRQEKNLRKWDAPVVADLDQDGYLDLLINDHGYGIQVCWNNKGKFAKPHDIIMGDLHGLSAGDFDQDGNIEVIMSRGGGSGSNARNSKMYRVTKGREFIGLPDFSTPLALMRGRTVQFIDMNNDGHLDLLNFAFPGKEKKGASENYVYENDGKGELVLNSTLPASKTNGQKSLVTDFNGDAIFDIVMYGDGNVKLYKGNGDFTFNDVSKKVLPYDIDHVNGIVEIDVDNDGDLDLFFNRGLEFKKGESFFDKQTNVWGFFTKRGQFQFDDLETGDILNIENFQSQWPNNDTYYIGEASYDYEFKGETHSGKNIRLVNSNALGFPDNADYNAKRGYYIGYVGNNKWRLAGYLFAPSTGIVRGVKNYPAENHPKGLNDILLENTGKKFKDATKKFNLYNEAHTVATTVADFDNNGFQDLLVIKRGDLIHENESLVYLNKGTSGFKQLKNHNIISTELGAIGMAVENIDYNKDGRVDVVVGNERGKWHLFKNDLVDAKTNSYLTVEVYDSTKRNVTALGALVTISSCGNKQVRRIGATGAQYSLSFNNFVHFGIANCGEPIKVKVKYTNGYIIEKTVNPGIKKVLIGKKKIKVH
ncbi:hypothetical protein A8C32_07500 [Flavivirga aquatica]|uniref:ASPIC/UnbV domain-containing protein n=1 Tax=Flavivirga aquatica TaxID=1849968 RepID=A0A1E5SIS6_9FLAO|nr:VCBS repeat-containing protein [Flavivirga aquatica]OEJ99015.1 hypothetical protein A8C32_07500 [Flavivirga aquatica]